jgi:hypothetical protein
VGGGGQGAKDRTQTTTHAQISQFQTLTIPNTQCQVLLDEFISTVARDKAETAALKAEEDMKAGMELKGPLDPLLDTLVDFTTNEVCCASLLPP